MEDGTPAAYGGFRIFLMASKATGCCFVDGVFSQRGPGALRPNLSPRQVVYLTLCLCAASLLPASFSTIRTTSFAAFNQLHTITGYGFFAVIYAQALVNILHVMFRRSRLIQIIRIAADVERKLYVRKDVVEGRLRNVSLFCLCFALFDGFKYVIALRYVMVSVLERIGTPGVVVRLLFVLTFIIGCLVVSLWYNLCFWMIVFQSEMVREYFAAINDSLEAALATTRRSFDDAERIRMNLIALRRLLRSVNSYVGAQALLYYAGSVFFLCATLYRIMISEGALTERASRLSHLATMSLGIFLSARAAHRMSEEVSLVVLRFFF